jgi:hypothetical protein
MASETTPASHKRTSSAAENSTTAPETKRRDTAAIETSLQDVASPPPGNFPQYAYIVIEDYERHHTYEETYQEIKGVFMSTEDANNRLRGVVNDEYSTMIFRHGVKSDGRIWWKSSDVGEGDKVELRIEKHEFGAPGSEPKRELINEIPDDEGSYDEDGDEDDDDGEEQEE